MVSFTCNNCQDVVKKPKVNGHAITCGSRSFTCVDCMEMFDIQTIKGHTSCITETEKYQGKWKNKIATKLRRNDIGSDGNNNNDNNNNNNATKKRQFLYSSRPQMNISSESDDSNDDSWVTAKKGGKNGHNATDYNNGNAASKTTATNGQDKSCEDHNDPPQKRPKEFSLLPGDNEAVYSDAKRHKPELCHLPQVTVVSECVVPSFVLGTDEEVASVARCVLDEEGESGERPAMSLKRLAKKIVERYNSRIAKHVRAAINTVIQNGKLQEQDGVVTAPLV